MGRLCVVSRDAPTLPGYLMVVLDKEIKGPEGLDLIFDRRHAAAGQNGHSGPAERRHSPGVDEALRTRGFAIIGEDDVMPPLSRARRVRSPAIPSALRVSRRGITTAIVVIAVIAGAAAATQAVLSISAEERERMLARAAAWIRVSPDPATAPERGNAPSTVDAGPASTPTATSTRSAPDARGVGQPAAPAATGGPPTSAVVTASPSAPTADRSRGESTAPSTSPLASSSSDAARSASPGTRRDEGPGQVSAARTTPRPDPTPRASSTARSDSGARADATARAESAAPTSSAAPRAGSVASPDSGPRPDASAGPGPSARPELPALPDPPARREALARSETPTLPPSRREPGPSPLSASGRPEVRDSSSPSAQRDATPIASNAGDAGEPAQAPPANRRSAAAQSESPRARTARAAGPPRVELDAQPGGADANRAITYTARIWDGAGRPVDNARVTLRGWMPNGSDLETALDSTTTPGTYRGTATVGTATPGNLRVRVMYDGARFEIPSGR